MIPLTDVIHLYVYSKVSPHHQLQLTPTPHLLGPCPAGITILNIANSMAILGDVPTDFTTKSVSASDYQNKKKAPSTSYNEDSIAIEEGRMLEKINMCIVEPGVPDDWTKSRWQNCKLTKGPTRTEYNLLFEDSNLFVLNAKKINGKFYISQYRRFSNSCTQFLEGADHEEENIFWNDAEPSSHYVAVVERDRNTIGKQLNLFFVVEICSPPILFIRKNHFYRLVSRLPNWGRSRG